MKLASSFPVPASPDKVLSLFLDPGTMKACIPGCEELVQVDDTHYRGSLVNEVAHVRFRAGFNAEITSLSSPSETTEPAVVTAVLKGEDRRLGSTVRVEATLTVAPQGQGPDSSEVSYEFELAVWGKLGRLGESVIRRRTMEVEKQFAEALTAVCAGQPVPIAPERPQHRAGRQASSPTAVTTSEQEPGAGLDGASTTPSPAAHVVGEPARARSSEDWAVLGLAVAAAFAYGMIFGGRRKGVAA